MRDLSSDTPPRVDDRDPRLREELLRLGFVHTRGTHLAAIIAILVLTALLARQAPGPGLVIAWAAVMVGIEIFRGALGWRFRKQGWVAAMSPALERSWRRGFLGGTIASGLGWAAGAVLLVPALPIVPALVLSLVVVGVIAVAVPALASSIVAYFSYAAPSAFAVVLALGLRPEPEATTAAALAAVGVIILAVTARRTHRETVAALSLKLSYADQSRELKDAMGERRRAEDRAMQLAYYDQLTRLPNRTHLHEELHKVLERAGRDMHRVHVLLVDVDRFKGVNESLGPEAGDHLLRQISRRLRETVGEGNLLARISGRDEFALVLSRSTRKHAATEMADRILYALSRPMLSTGQELSLTVSVGIARFPDDGDDAEALLRAADSAMARAKSRGRNTYEHYAPEAAAEARERLIKENQLRKALERQEFEVHFQPLIDLGSSRVAGMEALVRWRREDGSLTMPDDFIPLAEQTGLITPLGEWVLRESCRRAASWQASQDGGIHVAVNLSLAQFTDGDLPRTVAAALAESGLPPECLYLEITESVALIDRDTNVGILKELKKLGVRLALDDFGTGNSSLSHLKYLPVDMLKIDREFARDLDGDAMDAAIARATITLARSLGLEVIAEGVERPEQMHWLSGEGCALMQGFFFSKPQPADACPGLLSELGNRLASSAYA